MNQPSLPYSADGSREVSVRDGLGRFGRTLAWLNHVLVGDFVLGRASLRYTSLAALLVATVIGLGTYVSDRGIWGAHELSLRPDLISTLAALMLVSALYVRRLIDWAPSVYSILSLVLNITITAILVEALLGGSGFSIRGLAMPWLVGFAIVLTWTGMRPVATLVWALVVVVGFVNLQVASAAMGMWGYLFIILSAIGVFLQLQPSTKHLLPGLRYEFTGEPSSPVPARRPPVSESDQ